MLLQDSMKSEIFRFRVSALPVPEDEMKSMIAFSKGSDV